MDMGSKNKAAHFVKKYVNTHLEFFATLSFSLIISLGLRIRGLCWLGHTCVKNLPGVGFEILTKFGGVYGQAFHT